MSKPSRIAITLEFRQYGFEELYNRFTDAGMEPEYRPRSTGESETDTAKRLAGFDAVLAGGDNFSPSVLRSLSAQLKIIARFGTGFDRIDLGTATEHGICVTTTPGCMSIPVAEMAVGLMLALARNVARLDGDLRHDRWNQSLVMSQLTGTTVGLVGFGHIAQQTAELLSGFRCTLLAFDPAIDEALASRLGVVPSSLIELLRRSDFVSVHVPLTDDTRGMVDSSFLRSMQPTAFLVNTSRGAVVDEPALIEALRGGFIAGAGLDVFVEEPLPADHHLTKLPNTVLTPHVAAITNRSFQITAKRAADNIVARLSGRVPRDLVNQGVIAKLGEAQIKEANE